MKLLLSLLTFLMTISLFSQDFEGVVSYKIEYNSSKSGLSEHVLKEKLGANVKTYFKDGFYMEESNSTFMSYQQYNPKDTLVYFKNNIKSDTLFYHKVNTKANQEFSYKIEKETDTILGYVCDKLIVNDIYGTKTYYYSNKLSLNPKYYKYFLNSNKNKIVELMKAIYLRLEMQYVDFTVDIIATEVKSQKVEDSKFKLPENHILIESKF